MLFECVTRNCAFDFAAADGQHENHGASVRRDGGREVHEVQDVALQVHPGRELGQGHHAVHQLEDGTLGDVQDALVPLADAGLPGGRPDLPGWATGTPLEIVLVVEGAARGVRPVPGVRVEPATGSGDDRIVELLDEQARRSPGRPLLLITSDRELRRRAAARGAVCAGPRTVRP